MAHALDQNLLLVRSGFGGLAYGFLIQNNIFLARLADMNLRGLLLEFLVLSKIA